MRFRPAAAPGTPTPDKRGPLAAPSVAAGIFVSRVFGFARQVVFAHHFGTGALADAWGAALRIPNVLQNLLGEGTLSASFIPVYARLLEEGREEEAGRVAGALTGNDDVADYVALGVRFVLTATKSWLQAGAAGFTAAARTSC